MWQRQKGHGNFMCHGDKPALFLLQLTIPTRKYGMCPLVTNSTVNESTSDSMARTRVTAGAYNQNVDKR